MAKQDFPKDYFTLVNEDDKKISDIELKTKQLSYFQDAMVRFGRNKYNVIATIILATMILLSIIVPILTPEELYSETNSTLDLLPPRVPILSDMGIFDGTKFYKNITVDRDTIRETTGLGVPNELEFNEDFIDMSTLDNYIIIGSEIHPDYVGGTVEMGIDAGYYSVAAADRAYITLSSNETIYVDVNEISGGTLEIYMVLKKENGATEEISYVDIVTEETVEYVGMITDYIGDVKVTWDNTDLIRKIGEVDTAGVTTIDVSQGAYGLFAVRFVSNDPAGSNDKYISLNSIYTEYDNGVDDPVLFREYTGYTLANFQQVSVSDETEQGTYLRKNAERLVASFVYDAYSALFDDVYQQIGGKEYDRILSENPGMEDSIKINPNDDNAWTFDDGYPITRVLEYIENDRVFNIYGDDGVTIIGTETRTIRDYKVMMDGQYALGFDEIPYFLFGTDVGGKDLFSLIWLGLRTSLLLGFLAALTNIFFGIIWGSISGYYGGQIDILMERFTDIWGSFPQITMISIITVIIGPGFLALYIFMVYDGWIGAAKITRLQFYRYRGREYVLAARTMGATDRRIIFKHILPNALGTIVTRVILSIPAVIFLEVNLSYLGFGIGNGQKLSIGPIELTGTSIGVILNDGQTQILAGNLWLIIYPTIIVSILMITFNMFGNALRDALNPQLRGSN
ncbi:ABC transporter permease [Candidatus Xianfuyuplasma coldseepsis]|uniref:ABC transporter permease n=1 Tax=Candidatus Xianfuyuplasma coldseepsis TaxID=2782163 RepID=A0A7L7KRH8_9MOLU|nr:ABC transporter permease [Xianfuyuplasma coldseepsis]QMS85343.1 ABC transporter permease [Xianfuyuplasma coldseepsis]